MANVCLGCGMLVDAEGFIQEDHIPIRQQCIYRYGPTTYGPVVTNPLGLLVKEYQPAETQADKCSRGDHDPETQLFVELFPFGSFVDAKFVVYRDHADIPRVPVDLMVCKHCRDVYLPREPRATMRKD